MKNIKYLLMLFILLIPFNGYAIEFYCDRNVSSNKEFKCIISNSSNSLYNLTGELDYSSDITLIKEVYSKGYSNSGSNKNLNIVGPGFNAPTTIGILTFKAPDISNNQTYNISLKNIKYKYLSTEVNYHDNEKDLSSIINVKGNGTSSTTSTTTTTTTTTTKVSNLFDLTIHYMNDKGNDTLSCEAKNNKCTINISDIELPIKDGYEFIGWSEKADCLDYNNNQIFELTANKDIYACYKANQSEETVNFLESLTIEGYPIEFSKFIGIYNINVKGDVTKLNVSAKALSSTAKINISDNVNNLVDGINSITIEVVDNGTVTTYVILASKNTSDVPMLDNITIDKYNLNFKPSVFEYNLVVKYGVKKLNLNIVNGYNYEYEIIGNDNLSDGSKITINVKNGFIESNYIINIKYESFISSYLYYVYGASFILFCIIVYFIVKYLRSDKYKNKKIKDKNMNLEPKKEKKKSNNKKEKKVKKETIEKL